MNLTIFVGREDRPEARSQWQSIQVSRLSAAWRIVRLFMNGQPPEVVGRVDGDWGAVAKHTHRSELHQP